MLRSKGLLIILLVMSVVVISFCTVARFVSDSIRYDSGHEGGISATRPKGRPWDWSLRCAGARRLKIGISVAEIVDLMGPPDEEHALYEPVVMAGRRIGTNWFYFQDPNLGIGGNGKEIHVQLDLQGRLKDAWDNMGGISREKMLVPHGKEEERE
jgi:hypothetical protein